MTIDDKIRDEKAQHNINRGSSKNIGIIIWKNRLSHDITMNITNMNMLQVKKYCNLIKTE